ncbi:hypothetical protein ZOSMA_5G00730 [Zostera marina]|uniref:Uncharacterized protein n=1 Tax=Zostera marina TaxID=29655 RepID=A0A0K9NW78_ZOSMR|nr:hypothetical protein ZOSMA_5G00730 [Zostera marina]
MANRDIEDEEFKFARRPRDIAPTRTITQYMISPEEKSKKGKKAILFKPPPEGMRYIVKWDDYKTPLAPEGEMLDAKIRDISMQSDMFPLDKYWTQQSENSMSEAFDILSYDFDMSKTTTVIAYWYMQVTMSKKLRNYRSLVKTKYFKNKPNKSLNFLLRSLPHHIDPVQFSNMHAQWNTPKGKEKEGIDPTRTATMVRAYGKSHPKIQKLLEVSNSVETRNLAEILPKSEVEQMTFDQALGKNKKKRKLGIGEGAFLENSPSSGRFIRQHEMKLKEKEPAGVFLSQEQHDMMMRHMMEMENELKNLKENRELPNRRSRF